MSVDARLNRKFWAGSNVTARIAEIWSMIAAAIEEQGAASQEIAGNAAAILRGGLDPEVLRTEDQIRQGVAVERPDECHQSFLEHTLEPTARRDQATVLSSEAFNQDKIGLGGTNNVA